MRIKKLTSVGCISIHPPLSKYLVEPPFAEITAASRSGYVSTSFAHLEMEMFVQSSWQKW